jgi:hypothetical protein
MLCVALSNLTRAGASLLSAGSGRAWALHCGLGLLRAKPGLVGGLRVWPAALPKNQARVGSGLGPLRP